MKLPRRRLLQLAASAAALPTVPGRAWAEAYPTRPVRWIIPFSPGGGADIVSRVITSWLADRLGEPVIIESKPGGGTNIGAPQGDMMQNSVWRYAQADPRGV